MHQAMTSPGAAAHFDLRWHADAPFPRAFRWSTVLERGSQPCHAAAVSKAFTSEEAPDEPPLVPSRPPLPAGVPNYVTPRGFVALREERRRLLQGAAPARGPHVDDRARAMAAAGVDARLHALDERIASAVVVDAAEQAGDRVRFGARVTVRDARSVEHTYEIVGVDEADAALGRIAFVAPVARALLGKTAGESVTLRSPRGAEELEIVDVAYPTHD